MAFKNKLYWAGFIAAFILLLVSSVWYFNPQYYPENIISNNIAANPASSTPTREVFTSSDGDSWSIDDIAEFTVASAAEAKIKFLEGKIDPLKVHPGDVQYMRIVVQGVNGIAGVRAEIETDNGVNKMDLKKTGAVAIKDLSDEFFAHRVDSSGRVLTLYAEEASANRQASMQAEASFVGLNAVSAAAGEREVWEGSWTVQDTSVRDYITTFVAYDSQGNEEKLVLAWSDPCLKEGGAAYWEPTGNVTTDQSCTISSVYGVDNGTLTVTGGTILMNTGGVLAINDGADKYMVVTGSGNVTFNGGQLQKTYICVVDDDGDLYPASATTMTTSAAADCGGGSNKRLYTMASTTSDCLDTAASGGAYVYQTLTGLIQDEDHDNYYAATNVSACVGGTSAFNGKTFYQVAAGTYKYTKAPLGWAGSGDCDDANAFTFPGQTKYFLDNADHNCDSVGPTFTWFVDTASYNVSGYPNPGASAEAINKWLCARYPSSTYSSYDSTNYNCGALIDTTASFFTTSAYNCAWVIDPTNYRFNGPMRKACL